MVAGNGQIIAFESGRLTYEDACEVASLAEATLRAGVARIRLDAVVETTTAALARLILLRRNLLKTGRDLLIIGLHGRAQGLYEVTRMTDLLPRRGDVAPLDALAEKGE